MVRASVPETNDTQETCSDCWGDNFGDGPVVLCPKHAAADDLLAALEKIATSAEDYALDPVNAPVKPQPKTESRIEREMRIERMLGYDHYKPLGHGLSRYHRNGHMPAKCADCRWFASLFTHSLSGYWQPPKPVVPKGFTRP